MIGEIVGFFTSAAGGGLIGGALRLLAEIPKLMTAKADRDHEYRMAQLAAESAREQMAGRLDEIGATSRAAVDQGEMSAWLSAQNAMACRPDTWASRLSDSVRPIVTYWFMALFSAAKVAQFVALLGLQVSVTTAVLEIWTEDDIAIFASIMAFWFLDRSLRNRGGVAAR